MASNLQNDKTSVDKKLKTDAKNEKIFMVIKQKQITNEQLLKRPPRLRQQIY